MCLFSFPNSYIFWFWLLHGKSPNQSHNTPTPIYSFLSFLFIFPQFVSLTPLNQKRLFFNPIDSSPLLFSSLLFSYIVKKQKKKKLFYKLSFSVGSVKSRGMGKKRKSIATSLDEVDRSMYTSFCSAANSLSQLYTQAMNHQKLSFQAGERHALDKIYQWICRQQEGGSRVTTGDILNYLQNELEYCGEEPSMSPRVAHQQTQASLHFTNSGFPISSGSSPPNTVHGVRSEQCDNQSKNSVFSNALSSPVRQSLQHYHISYPGPGLPSGNGARNNETNFLQPNRDANPPSSNDSSMDMHADSPGHY